MSLALCGAHRTGKSTLADAFARKHNVPFVKTGTSEVFARLGLDPKAEYPIEQRISIQGSILYALEEQWLDAGRRAPYFISDRSPLDLASYLLADVQRRTLLHAPHLAEAVNVYVERCIDSANRFFAAIVLVQPGIPFVDAAGKGPACMAYQEHLSLLQLGLMNDERVQSKTMLIRRQFLTVEQRLDALEQNLALVHQSYANSIGADIEDGRIKQH